MRKENYLKKIFVNSLLGFPIGIAILMINYLGTFFIAGDNVFKIEIAQLQDFNTLVLQLVFIGIVYCLFCGLMSVMVYLNETKLISDKFLVQHPIKFLLSIFIIIGITFVISLLITNKIFSENIASMNVISCSLILAVVGVYMSIKCFIQSDIIRKINNKIKERNN